MEHVYYHLHTLDAKKILNDGYQVLTEANGNYTVEFRCNFAEGEIAREMIRSTDSFGSNALFYQMEMVLGISGVDEARLQHHLLFLDFLDTFNKGVHFLEMDVSKSLGEAELKGDAGLPFRIANLFSKGLWITFDGKDWIHFVPFDKSNSMARHSRISFVDDSVKEKLDRRLLLDIDFSRINLIPSKYYAYRGLYMSTAYRIEEDESFCLDQETVIVLPDEKREIMQPVFTEKSKKLGDTEELEFGIEKKSIEMEFYDGEGLISPSYARYVSNILQSIHGFKRPSHSFQIRMPFTKGMLHEVDFDHFFSEIAGRNTPLFVKDVFGIRRDLRKARIILTKSMFKCCKWLKEWGDIADIEDEMKYFFDKMKQYGHAFYVTGTDARLSNGGTVRMNYQFWSTLAICPEDFTSILKDHVNTIDAIAELRDGGAVKAGLFSMSEAEIPEVNIDDYAPEDEEENLEEDSGEREKCLRAFGKNPAFLKDSKVREVLDEMRKTRARNLCTGRIEVSGEQRYLSRDLMRMMLFILWHSAKDDGKLREALKTKWGEISKECLFRSSRHFYMPEGRIRLKADKYYAFFRSPHLSRHEQCILRPFIKADGMYERYFSHLRGVVMVSQESFVPMMLGGADFDGDLVKIVSDQRIVNAVKRGAYEGKGKKKREFERKAVLPVIQIPSRSGKTCFTPSTIPFEVIANTFSNQVGQISNLAVKIAKKEYGTEAEKTGDCRNKCAECTIVTGMEIDAAKTGFHPTKNIEKLKKLGDKKSLYLEIKEKMAALSQDNFFTPYVKEEKHGTLSLYRGNPGKKNLKPVLKEIPIYEENAEIANIDRLPGAYLKYVQKVNQGKEEKKANPEGRRVRAEAICFSFQENTGWKEGLDTEKKNKVRLLMEAYQKIRSRDYNLKNFRRMNKDSTYLGYIYKILQIQYDSFHQLLPCGMEVETAYSQTYMVIREFLGDSAHVTEALERMAKERWHFTAKDKRPLKLATILGDGVELPKATLELLSNFRNNGFMLLYYLLKEMQSRWNEGIDAESYKQNIEKAEQKDEDNPYLQLLEEIYGRNLKKNSTWKVWHREIILACRDILKDILGGWNPKTALKYVFACPQAYRRNFLWNVFTEKELLMEISPRSLHKDSCEEAQTYVR